MSNIPDKNPPSIDSDEEPLLVQQPSSSLQIELNIDPNLSVDLDHAQIRRAVEMAVTQRGFDRGEIGIRITDDPSIRVINARHLGHDYETDVISFGYHANPPRIEGELIASLDTAKQQANKIGWPWQHELLLYIVHGTLHITGMDDRDEGDRDQMRIAEAIIMTALGIDEIVRCGADVQHKESPPIETTSQNPVHTDPVQEESSARGSGA